MPAISSLKKTFLLVSFSGKPSQLDVMKDTEKALTDLSQSDLTKALVDTRELEILFPLSLSWYRDTWYPNAIRSGLRQMAIVVPPTFLADIDATCTYNSHFRKVGIRIRLFSNFSQAKLWLEQS